MHTQAQGITFESPTFLTRRTRTEEEFKTEIYGEFMKILLESLQTRMESKLQILIVLNMKQSFSC